MDSSISLEPSVITSSPRANDSSRQRLPSRRSASCICERGKESDSVGQQGLDAHEAVDEAPYRPQRRLLRTTSAGENEGRERRRAVGWRGGAEGSGGARTRGHRGQGVAISAHRSALPGSSSALPMFFSSEQW